MSQRRFAIRTVKGGAVRIGGRDYRPHCEPGEAYDGRFEGHRLAFGLYPRQPDFHSVSLWGTERDYYDNDMPDFGKPPVCVDHVFEFEWWDAVTP